MRLRRSLIRLRKHFLLGLGEGGGLGLGINDLGRISEEVRRLEEGVDTFTCEGFHSEALCVAFL